MSEPTKRKGKMKFKIGDKVKVIKDFHFTVPGKIKKVGRFSVWVEFPGGLLQWFPAEGYLEIVKSNEDK